MAALESSPDHEAALVEWCNQALGWSGDAQLSGIEGIVTFDAEGLLPLCMLLHDVGVEGIEEDSHKGEAGSMADEATVSALQAELEGFLDVHAQFTHPHLAPLGFDAAKAAAGDTQALVVLAACTLVAALRSDGRQEFVQIIMDLPEAQQQALMTATKTLMERMAQPSGEEAEAEWDGEEEAVHLRAQVRQLKLELEDKSEQLAQLAADMESAPHARKASLGAGSAPASAPSGQGLDSLLQDLRAAEQELQASQAAREKAEAEMATLRDELDVAKGQAQQLVVAQEDLGRLQRKLEEAQEAQQQLQGVQADAQRHLQRVLDLEEETKALPALQKRLEEAKGKVADLEAALASATSKASAQESLLAAARDDARAAKEHSAHVQEQLEATQVELKAARAAAAAAAGDTSGGGPSAAGVLSSSDAERLLRLERENAALKASASGSAAEELEALREQVQDKEAVIARLTKATTAAEAKAAEAELKAHHTEASGAAEASGNQVALQEAKAALEAEKQAAAAAAAAAADAEAALQGRVGAAEEEAAAAQAKLQKVEERNEKLEVGTRKMLDLVKREKAAGAAKASQMKQLQGQLELLQGQLAAARKEQDHMAAAVYNLGSHLVKDMYGGRAGVAGASPGGSWLARTRGLQSPMLRSLAAQGGTPARSAPRTPGS